MGAIPFTVSPPYFFFVIEEAKMLQTFIKKITEVQAIFYAVDGSNHSEVKHQLGEHGFAYHDSSTAFDKKVASSLLFYVGGKITYAVPGDWVVFESKDLVKVYNRKQFEALYEDKVISEITGPIRTKEIPCVHPVNCKHCSWCGFELYDKPIKKALELGDFASPVSNVHALRINSTCYNWAVVSNINQDGTVTLSTLDTKQNWRDVNPVYYQVVGKASKDQLQKCRQKLLE